MSPSREFLHESLAGVTTKPPVFVARETPTQQVLATLAKARQGAALVMDGARLVGVFTERDALLRVAGVKGAAAQPVSAHMSAPPITLAADAEVYDAVRLMDERGLRHLPLVAAGAQPRIVSIRNLVDYVVEHYPVEVYNQPPDPGAIAREPAGA